MGSDSSAPSELPDWSGASSSASSSGSSGPPTHGGNLAQAVSRFGLPRAEWLDLSTGINPHPYPAPALKPDAWHRLPEPDAALTLAAQAYYNAPQLLAVAGTQAAIQALPQCRLQIGSGANVANVVIASPTYAEHAHCWAKAGHNVIPCSGKLDDLDAAAASADVDVMLICNPNNPTGVLIEPAQLLQWHAQLAARGGWLVIDEAFGDTVAQASVAACADKPGLIVLKSVGKFFGLAGLRLGFVAAESVLLKMLADHLGPWSVSGPAQQVGAAALDDRVWQQRMRQNLANEGARLQALMQQHGLDNQGTALFRFSPLPAPQAERFWLYMAQRGIWVRLFAGDAPADTSHVASGVRLGLPPDEAGWQRLGDALAQWRANAVAA
jgi:cobalamin biosynthetic protein CobC